MVCDRELSYDAILIERARDAHLRNAASAKNLIQVKFFSGGAP
jgi:hypothetical protein